MPHKYAVFFLVLQFALQKVTKYVTKTIQSDKMFVDT